MTTFSGGAITFTWTSSYLQNLNLTKFNFFRQDEQNDNDQCCDASGYFSGYGYVKPTPPPAPTPPPPPATKVPTALYTSASNEKVKPPVVGFTGDGSGFYGGRTGHYATGGPASSGQLRASALDGLRPERGRRNGRGLDQIRSRTNSSSIRSVSMGRSTCTSTTSTTVSSAS